MEGCEGWLGEVGGGRRNDLLTITPSGDTLVTMNNSLMKEKALYECGLCRKMLPCPPDDFMYKSDICNRCYMPGRYRPSEQEDQAKDTPADGMQSSQAGDNATGGYYVPLQRAGTTSTMLSALSPGRHYSSGSRHSYVHPSYVSPWHSYVSPRRSHVSPRRSHVSPWRSHVSSRGSYVGSGRSYISPRRGSYIGLSRVNDDYTVHPSGVVHDCTPVLDNNVVRLVSPSRVYTPLQYSRIKPVTAREYLLPADDAIAYSDSVLCPRGYSDAPYDEGAYMSPLRVRDSFVPRI